jgi:hypothetical protein
MFTPEPSLLCPSSHPQNMMNPGFTGTSLKTALLYGPSRDCVILPEHIHCQLNCDDSEYFLHRSINHKLIAQSATGVVPNTILQRICTSFILYFQVTFKNPLSLIRR